jgi:hypothetical protein
MQRFDFAIGYDGIMSYQFRRIFLSKFGRLARSQ